MTSLIHLGFSVIAFIIAYGLIFTFTPVLLGSVFTTMDALPEISNEGWSGLYDSNKTTVQYLIPLIPAISIFIFVIRILMRSAER
jgi:hypothetical protein